MVVGGMPVTRLAERIGSTPFYAYDRGLLTARATKLKGLLAPNVDLHYAMKANPMPAVVQHMAGLVDGIDVASAQEMSVALDAGVSPHDVSFAGPGKAVGELRQAVAAGILVNVESFAEIERLETVSTELGLPARVAVRVNPDFELKGSGMKMGGGAQQFGIDAELVPEALQAIGDRGLAFEGFHIFAGSQNLRQESIASVQEQSFELALRLAEGAPGPVRWLNLGGGLGVPYFPGDQPLDLGAATDSLNAVAEQCSLHLGDASIVLELGRYLVAEAGVYVCRVVDRKVSRGHTFLVTDGGLHHHLAASGNFGQVLRKNYPVAIATRMGDTELESSSVVGPLCTPLDLLADKMDLPAANVGDLVVVFQSGAYGASASPQGFLSHPRVREALV